MCGHRPEFFPDSLTHPMTALVLESSEKKTIVLDVFFDPFFFQKYMKNLVFANSNRGQGRFMVVIYFGM